MFGANMFTEVFFFNFTKGLAPNKKEQEVVDNFIKELTGFPHFRSPFEESPANNKDISACQVIRIFIPKGVDLGGLSKKMGYCPTNTGSRIVLGAMHGEPIASGFVNPTDFLTYSNYGVKQTVNRPVSDAEFFSANVRASMAKRPCRGAPCP